MRQSKRFMVAVMVGALAAPGLACTGKKNAEPAQIAAPAKSAEPAQIAEPAKVVEPAKEAEPAQVAEPAEAAEPTKQGTCTAKLSGGLERTFPCEAGLRFTGKSWTLILGHDSNLPVDFGGMITFKEEPKSGQSFTFKDLDNVMMNARDKKAEDHATWDARFASKPSPYTKKTIPTLGALELAITEIGPEPEVHGTATVTAKADLFTKNKQDVIISFEF